MKAWSVTAGLVFGWAAVAGASPFQLERVSEDANWVAHLDVDAMRSSSVVQSVLRNCSVGTSGAQQCPGVDKCLEKINQEWGIDVQKDLHAVTLYGPKLGQRQMVLIVSSPVDEKVMLRKAKKASDHKTVKYGDYEIHTWTDAKGTKHAHEAAGVFYKPDVMVFATGVEPLQKAIDVLDGKKPNLAGKKSPLDEKVSEGTILMARADGIDVSECPHHPAFVNAIKQFSYVKGEHNGKWFGQLAVTADSKQSAAELRDILQGLRAMVSLNFRDQPKIVKLLSEVNIKARGTTVRAEITAKADEVSAVAPAIHKAIHENIRQHAATHASSEKTGTREKEKTREARRERRQSSSPPRN